jgi:hypothetical protein
MSKTKLLHFDSINAQYINNPNNSAYYPGSYVTNPYEVAFQLPNVIRNVRSLRLMSAEIPVAFDNIRYKTHYLIMNVNGTMYQVNLVGSFTVSTIADFLTALNLLIQSAIPSQTITFTNTGSNLKIVCGATVTSLTFQDTVFSRYYLGIRSTDTFNSVSKTMPIAGYWNLAPDNYLNMYIPSLPSQNNNVNGCLSTFKIPLNAPSGTVYYTSEYSSFQQAVSTTDANFTLSQLQVVIYDRFGCNINPNGGDWSFSLLVEYDD